MSNRSVGKRQIRILVEVDEKVQTNCVLGKFYEFSVNIFIDSKTTALILQYALDAN